MSLLLKGAGRTIINIGETGILATAEGGNNSFLQANNAVLTGPAEIQSLSFYVDSGGGNLRLGIYDDLAGAPGTLKASTGEIAVAAGWNTAPVAAPVLLSAGTYYIAFAPSIAVQKGRRDLSATQWFRSFTYGPLPSAYGVASTELKHWSMYAALAI